MADAHAKPHHDYHLVDPSPWPAIGSVSLFVTAVGAIAWMHHMFAAAPWVFGAVHPVSEFALYVGVAVLLLLWAMRMLVEGAITWKSCPVALCLAALFLVCILQVVPISHGLLERLSPRTASLSSAGSAKRSSSAAGGRKTGARR